MSIATAIANAQTKIAAAYTACNDKGATMPASGSQNLSNLASTISSITTGGGSVTELSYPAWRKDGDTHLWLNISTSYQLAQQLCIRMIGTIDWGDGTVDSVSVTTYTTFSHTYAATGNYRIDLHPTSGTFYLGGNSSTYNVMGTRSMRQDKTFALYQLEIGSLRITQISNYAFYGLSALQRVYIPANITTIKPYAFAYCRSLYEFAVEDASKLTSVDGSVTFAFCYILQECDVVTTTASMGQTFRECACLHEITIPSNVTSINTYTFYQCLNLKYLRCKPTTPPTVANANAFSGIPSDCVIEVPSASLAAYQAASIWSTYASQMVGV